MLRCISFDNFLSAVGIYFTIVVLLAHHTSIFAQQSSAGNGKKVVCIYGSWSVYRRLPGRLLADEISPQLCTHIIYTYAALVDGKVASYDAYVDLSSEARTPRFGNYARLVALKQSNPNLKVLISVGGWNAGGYVFSNMVANREKRKAFIDSAILFARKYGFDGVWMDWLYPGDPARGGRPEDREMFGILLDEFRSARDTEAQLKQNGLPLLFGLSVSGVPNVMRNYDAESINKNADLVGLITYDLYGSWSNAALHHAPLQPIVKDGLSVLTGVHQAISAGFDKNKLLIGIPTYVKGRNYELFSAATTLPGSAIRGAGPSGPMTATEGTKAYYEICVDLERNSWKKGEVSGSGGLPYAVKGTEWIGYDNEYSVRKKAEYAVSEGLAGVMIFSLEQDDPNGYCGIPFPLTNAARVGLGLSLVDTTMNKIVYKCAAMNATAHQNCQLRIACSYYPPSIWGPNEVNCEMSQKCMPPEVYDCVVNDELLDLVGSRSFNDLSIQAGQQSSLKLHCMPQDVYSEPNAPGYFVQCSSDTLGGESIMQYACPAGSQFKLTTKACQLP